MSFRKLCSSSRSPDTGDYLLKKQISWVLFLRVIILSLLLGISLLLQTKSHEVILPPLRYVTFFIVGIYLFTLCSVFVLRLITCYRQFAYVQIISDCLFTTCLIVFTGGSQSIFTIIFFFPILSSAVLLFRRGALLMAALSTCFYGGVLYAEYLGALASLFGYHATPLTSIQLAMHYFSVPGVTFFLVAILGSVLSERLQRAEAELTRTSQDLDRLALLYKQIFDDIATGIITVDTEGRITSFNRSAGIITGYAAVDVLGKKIRKTFPELTTNTDSMRPMTYLTKKQGEKIPVGYSWTKLNMPGNSDNSRVFTMQDLSRIKKMEEQVRQAEKMAAIGEMAAGIAHEFRNPLAAISGAAQVLQSEIDKNTSSGSLMNIIVRECDRLDGTIREFLQFSKPAAPEKKWFSLRGIVNESLDLLKQSDSLDERITITLHIPENLDCWGDAKQIKQVVLNLLENAGHAMDRHGGVLTLKAFEVKVEAEEKTVVEISDTGPGIAEKDLDQIFEPFYTTRENGTGLGLAIVKQLLDSHNGTISAANSREGGALFTVTLPLP